MTLWPDGETPWTPDCVEGTAADMRLRDPETAERRAREYVGGYHPGTYGAMHWGAVAGILSGAPVAPPPYPPEKYPGALLRAPRSASPAPRRGAIAPAPAPVPPERVLEARSALAGRFTLPAARALVHRLRATGSAVLRTACGGIEALTEFFEMTPDALSCAGCLVAEGGVSSVALQRQNSRRETMEDMIARVSVKPKQMSLLDQMGD